MLVTQDLHIHTNLSLCAPRTTTVEGYYQSATRFGLSTIAFTDHLWDAPNPTSYDDPPFYEIQNFDHICQLKQTLANTPKPEGLRVLFGAEADYRYETHGVAISRAHAEQLDVLLVPVSHTHKVMPREFYANHQDHIDFMHRAFLDICQSDVADLVTAIAHPFVAVCCPYNAIDLMSEIKDEVYLECFQAAKEANIAIEINTDCCKLPWVSDAEVKNSEMFRMFSLAKQCGCRFTFGSDAHREAGQNYFLAKAERYANLLGLTENDILYV